MTPPENVLKYYFVHKNNKVNIVSNFDIGERMSEVNSEQKIQLVQQIRTQYEKNQCDIKNRKQLMFGNGYDMTMQNAGMIPQENSSAKSESLKCRCAIAALLFIFTIIFDLIGAHPFGVSMEQVFTAIATDYQKNMTEFAKTMSDNLK